MNKIKQVLFIVIAVAFVSLPAMAFAATPTPAAFPDAAHPGFAAGDVTPDGTGLANATVFDLIANIMNWLLGLVGILAVVGFVIAGVLYLTAAGDAEQAEKAKSVMMYAIIGLVVALIGLIVVNAIAGLTGATGVGSKY